jgi:CRISPR-associated protein Cas1
VALGARRGDPAEAGHRHCPYKWPRAGSVSGRDDWPSTGNSCWPLSVAWNGVSLTDDLVHRCAADGRSITWVTRNGRFLARTSGPHTGNPHLRLAQVRIHDNPEARLTLAKTFVAGKLHNYRQLLLRAARDTTGTRQTRLRDIAEDHAHALTQLADAGSLAETLGIEGRAARDYFQGLDQLAPGVATGRTRRPPTDPVNCLLSFGYGMLRVSVHGALEQVGLDPYIGYLHGIRPAKPALALDLMEELMALCEKGRSCSVKFPSRRLERNRD